FAGSKILQLRYQCRVVCKEVRGRRHEVLHDAVDGCRAEAKVELWVCSHRCTEHGSVQDHHVRDRVDGNDLAVWPEARTKDKLADEHMRGVRQAAYPPSGHATDQYVAQGAGLEVGDEVGTVCRAGIVDSHGESERVSHTGGGFVDLEADGD